MDNKSIALTVFTLAARTQAAWDRGDFEQITQSQAAKRGYEGCDHDPKWYSFDTEDGWYIECLTNTRGGIECHALRDDDPDPLMFTLDFEEGTIERH